MATTELIDLAVKTSENAYVPYSHFPIGAVLVTDEGKIYTGVNIENASFGLTNCGERTAIFKAVSEGERSFKVMAEFFEPDLPVTLVAKDKSTVVMTVKELLPYSFTDLT